MPRSRRLRFLIVAGAVLIVGGVLLWLWMQTTADERNTIEVRLSHGNDTTTEIKFEDFALIPGEECEYDIILKQSKGFWEDQYLLSLDFVELADSPLKEYARVRIVSADTIVHDELLATVLEDEDIQFTVDFGKEKTAVLKILYYIPPEVGNEAKNAEALFKLVLTASNE